ncbi:MAG TPA: hypothetical protein VI670_04830 [Thermoanaerobaculia bacterium]|jgi:hypothetical protein
MLARSLQTLLAHLIDYAGLFPPAALSMEQALGNYARYREGEHAWMLGRFVVPAARAPEVPSDVPASVIGVDEVKAETEEDVHRIGQEAGDRTVYVEIADLDLLEHIAVHENLRAKIRTGGLTPDAFPSSADIANFMRACARHGVAFKATAGLHHPVRCVRPLTYESNAPTGTMHGFVNVFMAAALLPRAEAVLDDGDAQAFAFDDDAASWRGHAVLTSDLARLRGEFAISFGSCSFEEPVNDLKELGWLT